jgi:hypothetical protein
MLAPVRELDEREQLKVLEAIANQTFAVLRDVHQRRLEIEEQLREFERLQGERQSLMVQEVQLDGELKGLRAAIQRRRYSDETESEDSEETEQDTTPPDDWTGLNQPDAVVRALRSVGRPMGPAEIVDFLRDKGREDAPNTVSVSLMRLRRRGEVQSVGRGQWVAERSKGEVSLLDA